MSVLVVYESMYGNTRQIAEAIAAGLGGAEVRPAHEAATADGFDAVVVGGPTHMHGMTTKMSRKAAADAAEEDGDTELEPGATAEPGLRGWLSELTGRDGKAAAFDTRIDKPAVLTGAAARGIARRLRKAGFDVVDSQSFFVEESEGPLEDGELDRARAWGAELAGRLVG